MWIVTSTDPTVVGFFCQAGIPYPHVGIRAILKTMKIINDTIHIDELKAMSAKMYGDLVKAVVDVQKEIMAVDAEMHADAERLLLEQGSRQQDLWGINLYHGLVGEQFVEFDSMINVRPSQNNRSRGVEDEQTRKKIIAIVNKLITNGIPT